MHFGNFISTYCGNESRALCRAMSIAKGFQSLDNFTLTQDEALKFVASYNSSADLSCYTYCHWKELHDEIYNNLKQCKDPQERKKKSMTITWRCAT